MKRRLKSVFRVFFFFDRNGEKIVLNGYEPFGKEIFHPLIIIPPLYIVYTFKKNINLLRFLYFYFYAGNK